MKKDIVRMGAIGCGYWGPNLIRNFIEIPDAELVAIADLDQAQLDRITVRFPQIAVATQDFTDFFALNLDAVVIATPPQTHCAIAESCLEHGLHVLIEKPITLNSKQAQHLVNLAKQYNRTLMVGHTFEFNSAVEALKKMIARGELGDIYYIDTVRASLGLFQTQANVVWDLAPHDISILRYLLGEDPMTVSATGSSCLQNGIEDVAYATYQFPKNVLAHVRTSWLDPSKTRRVTVVGSRKMAVYDDVAALEKIKVYDKGVIATRRTETFGEFQYDYHYGDVTAPFLHFDEPLRVQCSHFLECVRTGRTPRTDGVNGLRVVQIIEATQSSIRQNGALVAVDYGDGSKNGRLSLWEAVRPLKEAEAIG